MHNPVLWISSRLFHLTKKTPIRFSNARQKKSTCRSRRGGDNYSTSFDDAVSQNKSEQEMETLAKSIRSFDYRYSYQIRQYVWKYFINWNSIFRSQFIFRNDMIFSSIMPSNNCNYLLRFSIDNFRYVTNKSIYLMFSCCWESQE